LEDILRRNHDEDLVVSIRALVRPLLTWLYCLNRSRNTEAALHHVSYRVSLRAASVLSPLLNTRSQHPIVPDSALVSDVTHVALAFMRAEKFNEQGSSSWPLFTTVEETRPKFAEGTKILVALGGWGDTESFSIAAKTEESRGLFANNVARMVEETGADGMFSLWF
jgi:hypothetical protein